LVTFGITPEYAETGYGYIEADGEDVKAFHEKPDAATAQNYVDAGNYYWNSGMFCFKAGLFLEELKNHSTDIYDTALAAYQNAKNSIAESTSSYDDMIRIVHEDMASIPEDSIDYAVMEKSNKVKVVASDMHYMKSCPRTAMATLHSLRQMPTLRMLITMLITILLYQTNWLRP
jgi:mannose-1-phosphate guanylyltransferase